jgi:hypothetical protein
MNDGPAADATFPSESKKQFKSESKWIREVGKKLLRPRNIKSERDRP